MLIQNLSRQTILVSEARLADTAFSRLKGLLGRTALRSSEGLVITHCRSIHMFFMRFAIDVVFADRNLRVVGLATEIRPFRISSYFFRSFYAIEVPAGTIAKTATQKGDQLAFEG